jgi:hypothetical protein
MNNTDGQFKGETTANKRLSKFCGGVVIAGLVIEIILASVYHGHASLVENWGPVFATTLITLGVFGEIYFSGKISESEEKLRRLSEEKVSVAHAEAARAYERAAILGREAANAHARTAEIERITEWRHISQGQAAEVISAIRRKLPNNITIECAFDPEAIMYANELRDLFLGAEAVDVDRNLKPTVFGDNPIFGLHIGSNPDLYAIIVLEAFQKAGIEASRLVELPSASDRLILYVGHKPR